MKRSIRTIAFTAILLLAITLASCASAVEPEVFEEEFLSTSGGTDLEGYEMTLGYGYNLSDNVLGYKPDTLFADLVMKRLDRIQKDMNCKISVTPMTADNFITASVSGIYMADAMDTISSALADLARVGMLYGLSSLTDYIDYRDEQRWGYRYAMEVVYYEDDLYAVCPMMWPEIGQNSYQGGIIINEDIVQQLVLDDPRDYIENGTWTWETFCKCLEDYYLEEGGKVVHYSMACSAPIFGSMLIRTNGDRFVEIDAAGNYTLGFYSPSAIKAMEEANRIYFVDYPYAFMPDDTVVESMINGETVMAPMNFGNITAGRVAQEMNNYGFLSWPVGPDVDPSYKFSTYNNLEGNCIGFSKLARDIGATATIVNELFAPFEDYDTMEKLKEYMSHNYFYDPRDCDVFFDMLSNAEYSYFGRGRLMDSISVFMNPGKTVTEAIEANRKMFETETEQYVMPAVRGIIALWGNY